MNRVNKDSNNNNPVTPGDSGTPLKENEDHEHSAIYKYNKETGKWEVRNPSGSMGYNYLYRDDYYD